MITWEQIKEYRARLEALSERDKQILTLARQIYNQMGFACQGAEQQNDSMQCRYEAKAQTAMGELEALLLEGGAK